VWSYIIIVRCRRLQGLPILHCKVPEPINKYVIWLFQNSTNGKLLLRANGTIGLPGLSDFKPIKCTDSSLNPGWRLLYRSPEEELGTCSPKKEKEIYFNNDSKVNLYKENVLTKFKTRNHETQKCGQLFWIWLVSERFSRNLHGNCINARQQ